MPAHIQVIPVDGITELPHVAAQAEAAEKIRERNELLLLSIASGMSVVLVSCAWVLLLALN